MQLHFLIYVCTAVAKALGCDCSPGFTYHTGLLFITMLHISMIATWWLIGSLGDGVNGGPVTAGILS